eukprot:TRINITY_DN18515_c0_g1_i1.p1 TRINITY_DN18515_c0_g1~~TRINITY_DN18515_c0_g1_i1.p1  ORF type:complete len:454 (+),score=138.23 TRINITY_DN18515_c0_g1_i1:62-1363(+)
MPALTLPKSVPTPGARAAEATPETTPSTPAYTPEAGSEPSSRMTLADLLASPAFSSPREKDERRVHGFECVEEGGAQGSAAWMTDREKAMARAQARRYHKRSAQTSKHATPTYLNATVSSFRRSTTHDSDHGARGASPATHTPRTKEADPPVQQPPLKHPPSRSAFCRTKTATTEHGPPTAGCRAASPMSYRRCHTLDDHPTPRRGLRGVRKAAADGVPMAADAAPEVGAPAAKKDIVKRIVRPRSASPRQHPLPKKHAPKPGAVAGKVAPKAAGDSARPKIVQTGGAKMVSPRRPRLQGKSVPAAVAAASAARHRVCFTGKAEAGETDAEKKKKKELKKAVDKKLKPTARGRVAKQAGASPRRAPEAEAPVLAAAPKAPALENVENSKCDAPPPPPVEALPAEEVATPAPARSPFSDYLHSLNESLRLQCYC